MVHQANLRTIYHCKYLRTPKNICDCHQNYSAASHGKGPIDGLGAAVKRTAPNQVLTRKAVINNAEDFYHVML